MTHESRTDGRASNRPAPIRRVHLPGFVVDTDIGLGDAIKRVTTVVGIRPCSACERRATALNRRLVFF